MEQRIDLHSMEVLFVANRSAFKAMVKQRGGSFDANFDPSDVVQDAYFDLQKLHSDAVADVVNPIAWLRKLVWRRFAKLVRFHSAKKRNRNRKDSLSIEDYTVRCDDQTPSSIVARRESIDLLQHAINQLSRDDQEILFLRLGLEFSNNEVAARLSMTPSGASAKFSRAVLRLSLMMKTK
jgi:RNA polymerase sigma factor (sigma-70 family)